MANKTQSPSYPKYKVVAQLFRQRVWQGERQLSSNEFFFYLTSLFFLLGLGIPLKFKLCPPSCIFFRFETHSFDFYLF